MSKVWLMVGAATAALLVPALPALAQTSPVENSTTQGSALEPGQAAEAEDDGGAVVSGEIVVTAQKRSERLADIPMSITALKTDNLSDRGQVRISDYLAQVPGLSAYSSSAGQTTLAVRGITTGGHNNPTVGIVVDDIPLGSAIHGTYGDQLVPELDPSIVQQIEVLRGPQGTLYGAASLGGLVRYVTTSPDLSSLFGRVEVGGSTVSHGSQGYSVRASINAPLADNVAASFSGFYRRDPGYVDDRSRGLSNVDYADVYGGRVAVLWKPSDIVKVRLSALVNATDGNGVSDIDGNPSLTPIAPYNQTRIAGSGDYHRLVQFYTANVDVDLDAAVLTSATGYTRNSYRYTRDYDPTRGAAIRGLFGPTYGGSVYFRAPSYKVSQELRLTGRTGGPLDWQIGGFFNHELGTPHFDTEVTSLVTGARLQNYTTDYFPTKFTEYAGFANVAYHVTSRFDIQAGVRYSTNKQTYNETVMRGPGVPGAPAFTYNVSKDDSWTYAISPRFKINRDLMLYARVSTGYRPGGPNELSSPGIATEYEADTTTNYEAGLKGSMFDRRLTLDAAFYWIDWKDIQLQLRDPITNFIFFQNAGKARSRGFEATATANPWEGMTLNATLGYSDAELREGLPTAPGAPAKGAPLPFTAKWTGSLTADQNFDLSQSLRGFVGGSFNHVGSRPNGFTAVGTVIMPAYETFDLRAGVNSGSYRLTFYVQNVTDKFGILAADPRSTSATNPFSRIFAMSIVRPRTFGLTASTSF